MAPRASNGLSLCESLRCGDVKKSSSFSMATDSWKAMARIVMRSSRAGFGRFYASGTVSQSRTAMPQRDRFQTRRCGFTGCRELGERNLASQVGFNRWQTVVQAPHRNSILGQTKGSAKRRHMKAAPRRRRDLKAPLACREKFLTFFPDVFSDAKYLEWSADTNGQRMKAGRANQAATNTATC